MSQFVTLELPDETVEVYKRGAAAARQELAAFIANRLTETAPPVSIRKTNSHDADLKVLETMDDTQLWEVAERRLTFAQQNLYDQLLEKNRQGNLTASEKEMLTKIGDEARRLTLLRAHAYMLLKWRGNTLPALETMSTTIQL